MSVIAVHDETHKGSAQTVRDVVLGMADGLTVPFALAAGVTGAAASSGIVLTAGVAEIVAGAISMGLGGYLAARSEALHYEKEHAREMRETREIPNEERAEVAEILERYGLAGTVLHEAVEAITMDRNRWVEFMMKNELMLEEPDHNAATRSAVLVGGGYVLGGIFPLGPYAFIHDTTTALLWSIIVTSCALLVFGAVRARVLAVNVVSGAFQSLLVGGVAAAVAFALAKLVTGNRLF
jgi:VIT1/CCC1 family predicted Fe2+/Mn2+ transporter